MGAQPLPEWGLVSVTADLMAESRNLAQLAWELRQEARSWTHPAAHSALQEQAAHCTTWAQEAALASAQGDYWHRLDALQLAMGRRSQAQHTLRRWWEQGELWNSHRIRPVPASLGMGLQ